MHENCDFVVPVNILTYNELASVPALRAGPSQQINLYCSNHGILSICMSKSVHINVCCSCM